MYTNSIHLSTTNVNYQSTPLIHTRLNKKPLRYTSDGILAIIRGTHELYPEFTVAWNSERRDKEYNYNKYGFYEPYNSPDYKKIKEREEATEWFYFMERRRAVGGDELMKAYEEILSDFMQSDAYNKFKY